MEAVLIVHIIGIMVIIALMFGAYVIGKRRGLSQANAQTSLLEEKLQTAINTHQAQMLELHSQNSALTAQNAELNNRLSDIKEQLNLVQQNEQLRLALKAIITANPASEDSDKSCDISCTIITTTIAASVT